jgi:UTP--glucose-1-phosphate uridylyltransferase
MATAFETLDGAHLVAVTPVNKMRMSSTGVVHVGPPSGSPYLFPVKQLAEKPEAGHPIYQADPIYGIVGRYLLQPEIFAALQELRHEGRRPVEVTDALERMRERGSRVHAYALEAKRQDVGEPFGQASRLLENPGATS